MPSGAAGGPNHTLTHEDFPTYRFADPIHRSSGKTFSTDDSIASSGTFSGDFTSASKFGDANDACSRSADPIFHDHINGVGTRRVEPRNTPTMINAVFNYRNFWDGRANNIFNGRNPWGDRDVDAGIWVKTGIRSVTEQKLRLRNASLASLAVGPPLNDAEMSCRGRIWPNIGRKLLLRQPLQNQKVHNQDSVLGAYSLSTPGDLKNGLNTTYKNLVMQAFNPKFWSYTRIGEFGAPVGEIAYNQMEANFSMFFGLALQLYQSTLISDQAPIDLSYRNVNKEPTWEFPAWTGIVKSPEEIENLKRGYEVFVGAHCNICHAGSVLTTAAVETNSLLVTPDSTEPGAIKHYYGWDHARIQYGRNAFGGANGAEFAAIWPSKNVVNRDDTTDKRKLIDLGFANTGVNDPGSDPGLYGVDDYGNPLSFAEQYVQYLVGNADGHDATLGKGVKDLDVLTNIRSCDFIKPLARIAITETSDTFKSAADVQLDGSREGASTQLQRSQNCLFSTNNYIPTVNAAKAALAGAKMAVSTNGAFKVPSLRNVELTGPYMHNGSMATLEQVVEFYTRNGNVVYPDNKNQHSLMTATLLTDPDPEVEIDKIKDREHLVSFLKTLTDDRVRYEKAPFDHPEVKVPHGHVLDSASQGVLSGNPINAGLGLDEYLVIPAVGASGAFEADGVTNKPLLPFENYLPSASVQ